MVKRLTVNKEIGGSILPKREELSLGEVENSRKIRECLALASFESYPSI